MSATKKYVYALTDGREVDVESMGLSDGAVYAVRHEGLAAVVSDLKASLKIRPRRRFLMAHQAVLDELLRGGPVLPMSFGTVVADDDDLRRLLDGHREEIREQLTRVSGAVEMSVRVEWKVDNVFAALLERSSELQALRDDAASRGDRASIVAMGERLALALEEERERIVDLFSARIETASRELRLDETKAETDLMKSALLIDRDGQEALEAAVHAAARELDESYVVHLSGPWPPHSFIDLELAAA